MERREGGALVARERLAALGLLLVMGTAWGGAVALAKLATSHGGHPVGLAFWQTACGGSLLAALSLLRKRPPPLVPYVLRFNFVCGSVGVALPAVGLFWSATHLSAGVVAVAFASMPLFTYGLAVLLAVERPERLRLIGVGTGLGAVLLLVLPQEALPSAGLAPWVLLALASSVLMSVENLYIAMRCPPGLDSLPLSCGRQLAAATLLAPAAFALDATVPLFVAWGTVQWAATGMALASAGAYTIFLHVVRTSGPVFASQTAYVITIAGVLWGMALFGERHSLFFWGAFALMLLGLMLVRPRRDEGSGGDLVDGCPPRR